MGFAFEFVIGSGIGLGFCCPAERVVTMTPSVPVPAAGFQPCVGKK